MTTEQAAKAVKITRATLQEWIASGKIKAPKVQLRDGKAVRLWTAADLRQLRKDTRRLYLRHMGRPAGKKKERKP